MKEIFIGIDLGGTNIKIGCFDNNIDLIQKSSVPTEAEMTPAFVIDRIVAASLNLLKNAGLKTEDVRAVGIGAPGPSKIDSGTILAAPNMPKFRNVPIRDIISEKLNKPVAFENDANAACWGEYVVGVGKGVGDMVFFTLGTGIGGGLICGGRLVHGFDDNAGELGHIIVQHGGRLCGCGQRGCVEAYASAGATAKRAAEAIEAGAESSLKTVLEKTGRITCKNVYEHLAAGDELAKKITDETAEMLAILSVSMVHVTGPAKIVFAGGMIAAGAPLLSRIKYYFREHLWQLKPESVEICFA
ncbi:MAG: ROK family protein, partial [Planctomycetes bacterium]|nr:ROK family protein [Planctomycetota bacterium]